MQMDSITETFQQPSDVTNKISQSNRASVANIRNMVARNSEINQKLMKKMQSLEKKKDYTSEIEALIGEQKEVYETILKLREEMQSMNKGLVTVISEKLDIKTVNEMIEDVQKKVQLNFIQEVKTKITKNEH